MATATEKTDKVKDPEDLPETQEEDNSLTDDEVRDHAVDAADLPDVGAGPLVVDPAQALVEGKQQREPSSRDSAFPGEGEHQLKGLFADPNPVPLGEALAVREREEFRENQRASIEEHNGVVLDTRLDPPLPESRIVSGTNPLTDLDKVDDVRVAGDRIVDEYPERCGDTIDPLREFQPGDPLRDPTLVDPQKANPATGVYYTDEDGISTDAHRPLKAVDKDRDILPKAGSKEAEGTWTRQVGQGDKAQMADHRDREDLATAAYGEKLLGKLDTDDFGTTVGYGPQAAYEEPSVVEGRVTPTEVQQETIDAVEGDDGATNDGSSDGPKRLNRETSTLADLKADPRYELVEGRSSMNREELYDAIVALKKP